MEPTFDVKLTKEQIQLAIQLLDAAVKSIGLQSASAALQIAHALQTATTLQAAPDDQTAEAA